VNGTALILQNLQQMDDRMTEVQDEQAKQSQLLNLTSFVGIKIFLYLLIF